MSDPERQVDSLKRELEEKDDAIFELSASLASLEAETKYQLQNSEKESQSTIRKLQEELRMLQHSANQLASRQKRRVTSSPVPQPPQAAAPVTVVDSKQPSVPTNRLAQYLLIDTQNTDYQSFLTSLLRRSDDYQDEILWWLLHYYENAMEKEEAVQLLLDYLIVSPKCCRLLVSVPPKTTIQNVDNDTLRKLSEIEAQLESPLQSPCTDTTLSIAQNEFRKLFLMNLLDMHSIPCLKVLLILCEFGYDLSSSSFVDNLVDAWAASARRFILRRDVAFRKIREPTTTMTTTPCSEETPTQLWMIESLRLLCCIFSMCDTPQTQWLQSKRASTLLAASLDLLEYSDTRELALEIVCFLQKLVPFKLLFVKIATTKSTAELWHRGPTAVEVLGQVLYKIRKSSNDTVLRNQIIRTFQMILLNIEDDRKRSEKENQHSSVYFMDVLGNSREYYAAAANLLIADAELPSEIRDMVNSQLEELAEDQAEKYAD